ncbi:MAG: PLP-dependent transferase [Austwickia sp.]|nr:PLP-dependent transferase [Austwickia sp.]MBK8436940.1 PLP-dependent transferase [Austwickia sp.]MBK9100567.1 PLP-dependent transferase [Austwickia sp.]
MTTQRPGGHPHGPAENPGHAGHAGHAQTWLAGAGRPAAVPGAPVNVPLELSTTYVAGGALEYARYGNPAWTAFEEVVGGLEGGRALVLSSGMAAVAATLSLVPVGGRVVAPDRGYNGTCALLRALERDGRLSVDWVDVDDTPAMIRALPGAAMVWIESPVNPTLEVPDVAALVAAAQEVRRDGAGPLVVTDNTFATPLLRTPLQDGADIVVHSASKYLAGHSDVVLGVVITGEDRLAERLVEYRMLHGAIAGPAETWLALRGLRTLHLRVERSCANAADLADRLADHPVVGRVRYPGFGAILAIEVGSPERADAVCEAVTVWTHATSLGGVESLMERRRRHPSEPAGVPVDLIRLSVGIEDVRDLWDDLDAALQASLATGA